MVVYCRIRRHETISTDMLIIAIIIFLVLIFRIKINFFVFICFELHIQSSIFTKLDKIGPAVNSSVKSDGICLRGKKEYISPCHMPHHLVIQYLLEWKHRHNNSKQHTVPRSYLSKNTSVWCGESKVCSAGNFWRCNDATTESKFKNTLWNTDSKKLWNLLK